LGVVSAIARVAASAQLRRPGSPGASRSPGVAPLRRARRIAIAASAICLIPAFVSYVGALTQSSNAGIGIRTVEWLRDNGARAIVNDVENLYYSLTAPATGGPALRALPQQSGSISSIASTLPHATEYYRPPWVRPVIHPALAGEGVWRATFAHGGSRPPVLVTSFRPDPKYPQLIAGVAWIDHTRTSTVMYPGRLEPAVSLASRGPMEVPLRLRPHLVATFNSGFKIKDFGGGFAIGGHAYAPMKEGLATIVSYRDGHVDVRAWTGGQDVGPKIIYARQNLPLIVNHRAPNPNLSDGPEWGFTLGNAVRVWRSAIGVDRHHNLIYGAANNQTVGSLASIMIRAGAVRAMELDINSFWVTLITYRHGASLGATSLLPDMSRSPLRYLTPDDRDFFAVYVR
jgi:Phosphodiester glycosidase